MQLLPERDCRKCTALQKREWGCETDAPIPMILDGVELTRCPRRPIYENEMYVATVLNAYRTYMRGILPNEGSLEDQPFRYVALMTVVEMTVAEAQAELDRRAARKARKAGG